MSQYIVHRRQKAVIIHNNVKDLFSVYEALTICAKKVLDLRGNLDLSHWK